MYDSFSLRTSDGILPITLSQRDQKIHARNKKTLAHAFSLTAIKDYEPYMDEIIKLFMRRLKEKTEETSDFFCDFGLWIRFCRTSLTDWSLETTADISRCD